MVSLVLMVAVVAVVAGVVRDEGPIGRTATTTTVPRMTQLRVLERYCDDPATPWPEVPAYVAGQPARTQVHFTGGGVASAQDTDPNAANHYDFDEDFGSTVISPTPDGRFNDDRSVLARTRAVACITYVATIPSGGSCSYEVQDPLRATLHPDQVTLEFATNQYKITVFELHSGHILHRGTIESRSDGCPKRTSLHGTQVAWGLTGHDSLQWITAHFVDGKPV